MQINYEEEARKKQREQQMYQTQRDPFKYGQEVARRRYSEIMSGLQNQKQDVSRSYSDMYQQARQMAVADRAAGGPSLSGGMKAQYSDLLSTREIGALGQIGAAQNQALRQLQQQEQSAFANAELEGQQATQIQLQSQQTQLGMIQQKNQILSDKNLTNKQKAEQLSVLGYNEEAQRLSETPDTTQNNLFGGISSLLGGTYVGVKAGIGIAKSVAAIKKATMAGKGVLLLKAGLAGKAILAIGAVLAIAYGVEKILEVSGVNEGKGLFTFDNDLGI